MSVRRWGGRKFGGELEIDKTMSLQKINKDIKDLGFEIYKIGFEEPIGWPKYAFRRHKQSKVKHRIKNSAILVHALGDYTVKEWRGILFRKLRETNPKYERAAMERERKKKRLRERKKAERKERSGK